MQQLTEAYVFRLARALLFLGALSLAAGACGGSSDLAGTSWQLTGFVTSGPPANASVVPDPQNYTLAFTTDGNVNVKADCNSASGTYTVNGSNLTIKIGPTTLVGCPAGSLSDQYIAALGSVSTYKIENSQLTLSLASNAGSMEFKKG